LKNNALQQVGRYNPLDLHAATPPLLVKGGVFFGDGAMPIYEYKCQDCGHQLEAMQRVSEPALIDCPACGKAELKKLVSAAGFQLKGTGWYATDFRDKDKKKPKDEKKARDDGSKSEAKTDKKETPASASGSNDD
jgi:putative FmdB family regulatory protein